MHLTTKQLLFFLGLNLLFLKTGAQNVTIREETIPLETYDYGKPNPVPILSENPKIYPYFKFEEYEHQSSKKDWKVVTLENDYIKVLVLPEIGGKVWGAIEKSTGEEFLYQNDVVKFRNIAMRGPWTSGGIEFNFGIIGHHPGTATPVNYLTRRNDDGSVSCFVGTTDLPSNTIWQVEIRLEEDKAYFETNVNWYNASPLSQSYYNWMTGAAKASDDLQFFIPGTAHLEHGGKAHSWPIDDKGRDLSFYKNNNFGSSKSYHIVGTYQNFFGGYYHDTDFGFGQWAPYEEMPGQKLWLWALSRSGGIWEDLLTDKKGQYIEFQAGRLFNQYSPGETNPISQVGFDPYSMDSWSEIWFPFKKIKGMVDASPYGVLNVTKENGQIVIGLNALQPLNHKLKVFKNGTQLYSEMLVLKPMEIYQKPLDLDENDEIEIIVEGADLNYSLDSKKLELKRPFAPKEDVVLTGNDLVLFEGEEALEFRDFALAEQKFNEVLAMNPSHMRALTNLADIEIRKANYDKSLKLLNKVLSLDTYHTKANYLAGLAYRKKNNLVNALESFGWAARDMKFRSVAFAQMAELYLLNQNLKKAALYSKKALDFNTYNLNARKVQIMVSRLSEDSETYQDKLSKYKELFPLDPFVQAESHFQKDSSLELNFDAELGDDIILGLALDYLGVGLTKEATKLLSYSSVAVKNKLWLAFINADKELEKSSNTLDEISKEPVDFVHPFRPETLDVLNWATTENDHWKYQYYLTQNLYAVGRQKEADSILENLKMLPTSDVFYRFRAKMLSERNVDLINQDFEKALSLNKSDWKIWEEYIFFCLNNKSYDQAYSLSKKAYKSFKNNYNIGLAYAKSLLVKEKYNEVLKLLNVIKVLPYEHASESRTIYERAHLSLAVNLLEKKKINEAIGILRKAKEWPENIGVGKPFQPDERAQNFLLAKAYQKTGDSVQAKELYNSISTYSVGHADRNTINHIFGLLAFKELNEHQQLEEFKNIIANYSEKQVQTRVGLEIFGNPNAIVSPDNIPSDILDVIKYAFEQ
ncbi:DUF5107 domain-containing protein [Cytophaga sp. FL35]|uniref:DUF5107 domain-containing protein n=1 Tax=Cytophaga sp. FL35 TaxID=1904456 RepID=UPI001653A0AC|nr:DUF5107 domain-containing protein [Cytophaga sp. FL35]MBC6999178.1 DUF5107 domain-containing protein [Cytophaga sp. FL35]